LQCGSLAFGLSPAGRRGIFWRTVDVFSRVNVLAGTFRECNRP
jgi:hypothetical protein